MANPVDFEGANDVLLAPPAMGDDCKDLPIFRTQSAVISAWQLSPEEVQRVRQTGTIWIYAVGSTHPPLIVSGEALVNFDGRPAKTEPDLRKEKTK